MNYRCVMKFFYLFLFFLLVSCNVDKKDEIVAKVNGEEILITELSQVTKQEIFDMLNLAYNIKIKGLNILIDRKLLDIEANKQNTNVAQYVENYIKDRIGVNEDSLMQHYALNGAQLQYGRNVLSSVDDGDIEALVLKKNKLRSILIQELVDSLKRSASIEKYVYPPKQPECVIKDLCVRYRGKLESPVQMIVASDFNCERCVDFEITLKRIFDKYQHKVKFGYINFADGPTLASLACEAAAKQNKFWEFHDAIFEHKGLVDSTFIFNFASEMNLDVNLFRKDLESFEVYEKVDNTINKLVERGLFATPTIIINDRLIYVTNSYDELTKLLDIELGLL